jgi:hypothetical protein
MHRRLRLVLLGLVLAATALFASPAVAGGAPQPGATTHVGVEPAALAQQPDAPADDGTGGSADESEVSPGPGPAQGDDIIPKPNSGREPEEAGDRGGALQLLVFGLIVAGIGGIVAMIVRESRRNRTPSTHV